MCIIRVYAGPAGHARERARGRRIPVFMGKPRMVMGLAALPACTASRPIRDSNAAKPESASRHSPSKQPLHEPSRVQSLKIDVCRLRVRAPRSTVPLCGSSGVLRALLRPMQKVTSTGNAIGGETMRRTSRYWLGGRLGLSPSAHSDARNPLGGFSISTSRSGRWGTTSSARPRESGDRVAPEQHGSSPAPGAAGVVSRRLR